METQTAKRPAWMNELATPEIIQDPHNPFKELAARWRLEAETERLHNDPLPRTPDCTTFGPDCACNGS